MNERFNVSHLKGKKCKEGAGKRKWKEEIFYENMKNFSNYAHSFSIFLSEMFWVAF